MCIQQPTCEVWLLLFCYQLLPFLLSYSFLEDVRKCCKLLNISRISRTKEPLSQGTFLLSVVCLTCGLSLPGLNTVETSHFQIFHLSLYYPSPPISFSFKATQTQRHMTNNPVVITLCRSCLTSYCLILCLAWDRQSSFPFSLGMASGMKDEF